MIHQTRQKVSMQIIETRFRSERERERQENGNGMYKNKIINNVFNVRECVAIDMAYPGSYLMIPFEESLFNILSALTHTHTFAAISHILRSGTF